jgi:hypothetical protein
MIGDFNLIQRAWKLMSQLTVSSYLRRSSDPSTNAATRCYSHQRYLPADQLDPPQAVFTAAITENLFEITLRFGKRRIFPCNIFFPDEVGRKLAALNSAAQAPDPIERHQKIRQAMKALWPS